MISNLFCKSLAINYEGVLFDVSNFISSELGKNWLNDLYASRARTRSFNKKILHSSFSASKALGAKLFDSERCFYSSFTICHTYQFLPLGSASMRPEAFLKKMAHFGWKLLRFSQKSLMFLRKSLAFTTKTIGVITENDRDFCKNARENRLTY